MLPQVNRLKHEKDMETLFARGRSVFGSLVGMKMRPNGLPFTRFAVIVGVKTAKSAVARNRLKRRVRAIVHMQLAKIKGGYDVALLPRKEAIGASHAQLHEQIVQSFKKACLFL
jgi:ribonuclease P protein component